MPTFNVTCRGVLSDGVVTELSRRGVLLMKGGPTRPEGKAHRHHLRIDAKDAKHALDRARAEVEKAGGSCNSLDVND